LPEPLSYRRVALIRRVEYILDFLEVVRDGYSKEAAEARLAERKKSFEVEKARAVGRGRPFTSRLKQAWGLRTFTERLSRRIALADMKNGTLVLTENGKRFLEMSTEAKYAFLLRMLLVTYPSFWEVLSAIDAAEGHEVVFPLAVKSDFSGHARRHGISCDVWTFHVVRDLCSQLGVINWFQEYVDGESMQHVYMACKMGETKGGFQDAISQDIFPLHVSLLGREVLIEPTGPEFDVFRDTLWKEYLTMTKYIPRKPVFYSNVRDRVCYALRISDRVYDAFAKKMMEGDDRYLLLAGGGSLPYSRDSAGMLKSLPPQTPMGNYMIYLKMDERSS
jgi:hypothetical protein